MRLLPQNEALFGSDSLANFAIEKCADDPGTFVSNRGYHCDEEVERNLLVPSSAVKNGWRSSFHCRGETVTTRTHAPLNVGVWAAVELNPARSTSFELDWAARVDVCATAVDARDLAVVRDLEREIEEREGAPVGKREAGRVRRPWR